nr:gpi transamidase component gab1 [Quercus suber]
MTPLELPDLTPNTGLWWYFFIEMFDAFRSFFLGVFWLHMLSYSVPFSLRFHKQPLAAVVLMMGINAIFEPYANIGDVGAWLSSLCLLGHVFELTSTHRYTFPALAALLYGALLGPAFHHLWVYAGSGNANFFYAITLVWNLALVILLTDTVYAVLRDEWESERPEGKGKEVRQV